MHVGSKKESTQYDDHGSVIPLDDFLKIEPNKAKQAERKWLVQVHHRMGYQIHPNKHQGDRIFLEYQLHKEESQ